MSTEKPIGSNATTKDVHEVEGKPAKSGPLGPITILRVLSEIVKGLLTGVFDHQERVAQAKREALSAYRQATGKEPIQIIIDEKALKRSYSMCRVVSLLTLFWMFLLPLALTARLVTSHWWLGTRHTVADLTVWSLVFAIIPLYFLMILGLAINGWLTIAIMPLLGFAPVEGSRPEEPKP